MMASFAKVSTPACQARAKFLSLALAVRLGGSLTSHTVARWESSRDSSVGEGEPIPDEYRSRWRSHFQGVPFSPEARGVLYQAFPQLEGIYEDALWGALDPCASPTSFDIGAGSVRVDEVALPFADDQALKLLCGCPHWLRLKYLVVILRSRAKQFFSQRVWLHKNFTSYFLLACVRMPAIEMAVVLYDLIDALFDMDESLRCDGWPITRSEFLSFVGELTAQGDRLLQQRWTLHCGALRVMWLWQLLERRHVSFWHALARSNANSPRLRRPQHIAESVRDAMDADRRVKIEMDWA